MSFKRLKNIHADWERNEFTSCKIPVKMIFPLLVSTTNAYINKT